MGDARELPQSKFTSWGALLLYPSLCLPGLCCSRIVLALGTVCLSAGWMQCPPLHGSPLCQHLLPPAMGLSVTQGAIFNIFFF